MPLSEQDRAKLDGIVAQMEANKESEDNIKFVVNDFKTKYGGGDSDTAAPPAEAPKVTAPENALGEFVKRYAKAAIPNPIDVGKAILAPYQEAISRATGEKPGSTGNHFVDQLSGALDTIFPLPHQIAETGRQSLAAIQEGRPLEAVPIVGPGLQEAQDALSILPDQSLGVDTKKLAGAVGDITGTALSPLMADSIRAPKAPTATPPAPKLPPGVKAGVADFSGVPTAKKVSAAMDQVILSRGQQAAIDAAKATAGIIDKVKANLYQAIEGFSASSYFGRGAFEELRNAQKDQAAVVGQAIAEGVSKKGASASPAALTDTIRLALDQAKGQALAVKQAGYDAIQKALGTDYVKVIDDPKNPNKYHYELGSKVEVGIDNLVDYAKKVVAEHKAAGLVPTEAANTLLRELASRDAGSVIDINGAFKRLSEYEAIRRSKDIGPAKAQYTEVASMLRKNIGEALKNYDPELYKKYQQINAEHAQFSKTYRETFISHILENTKNPDATYRLILSAPLEHIDAFKKVLTEYAAQSQKTGRPLKDSPLSQVQARLLAEIVQSGFSPGAGSSFIENLTQGGGKTGAVLRTIPTPFAGVNLGAISDLFGSPSKIAAGKIETTLNKIGPDRLKAIFTPDQLKALGEYTKRLKTEPYVLSTVGNLAGQAFSAGILGATVKGLATANPSLLATAAAGVGMQYLPVIFMNPKAAPIFTRLGQAVSNKYAALLPKTGATPQQIAAAEAAVKKSPAVLLWASRLSQVLKEKEKEDKKRGAVSAPAQPVSAQQ